MFRVDFCRFVSTFAPQVETSYDAAAMLVTFVLFGHWMEMRSRRGSSDALNALLRLVPAQANVIEPDGQVKTVPVEQVQVGNLLLLRPGEKVPVDGQVTEGESAIDESMVTGESFPVSKKPGEDVIGGTVNGSGSLRFRATKGVEGLEWLMVIVVGLLVPFGSIWWGMKSGKWTNLHVSRRSECLVPLLVGLIALGGMLAGLLWLSASRPLVATLVAVIMEFALATLITQVAKYKISLHIDSAAGAVTVCCLLVSPVFLILTPLVVVIAWARWKLRRTRCFRPSQEQPLPW